MFENLQIKTERTPSRLGSSQVHELLKYFISLNKKNVDVCQDAGHKLYYTCPFSASTNPMFLKYFSVPDGLRLWYQ